jgi:hypothetical protein
LLSQLNQASSTGVPIQSGWLMAWSRVMGVGAAAAGSAIDASEAANEAAKRVSAGVRMGMW